MIHKFKNRLKTVVATLDSMTVLVSAHCVYHQQVLCYVGAVWVHQYREHVDAYAKHEKPSMGLCMLGNPGGWHSTS